MTKAELIRKIAKNVGVPDTDAKIFFELFLKRISAVIDIGQSILVHDFGYFHLIKGRIKKPVFSFKDNEVSEEEIGLVLFSEDKELRNSDTKGLVFNIPFFDEDDYHPIDSSFSLSIGKPLIPLRGVPFDNIYIPTSGYEYRRLIESKVEKIITSSEIAASEENFPTLVIDARSYNSNHVKLQWDDKSQTEISEKYKTETDLGTEPQVELSEYEKQAKELKNIAWDFGEDLSRQIEAESILDITDERMSRDLNAKVISKKEAELTSGQTTDEQEREVPASDTIIEKNNTEETKFIEEVSIDSSSEKLNELLESESKPVESDEEEFVAEIAKDLDDDIIIDEVLKEVKPDIIEEVKLEDEVSDKEFWESTSKYFEPYKPETKNKFEEEITEVNEATVNLGEFDSKENNVVNTTEPEGETMIDEPKEDEVYYKKVEEKDNAIQNLENDEVNDVKEDSIEIEEEAEQKPEFYQSEKKRNLIPFIVFPLLVIVVSAALYWYLEFYSKNQSDVKSVPIVLKSEDAKVIARSFDLPVSYPYPPKVSETIISETVTPKIDEPVGLSDKTAINNTEQKKPDEKPTVKEIPDLKNTVIKNPVNVTIPKGTSLNVGDNIFKYGNTFVVQVASYRASSIAENEAGKYRNKGFDAFVETAEIPNRGTWYRVRVGNFDSRDEAQSFVKKKQ